MSIFREHNTNADRSASDRRRHNKKIEDAIKDGVHNIVAEESIIGQDGKKKIKIPVSLEYHIELYSCRMLPRITPRIDSM